MKFDDIIGNKDIKEQMIKSITDGKFSHAHIISGEDGVGKSLFARAAALKLLGKDLDMDYPDIIKCQIPDKRKTMGVEQIRNLTEEVYKRPFEGDKKVLIVYEADKMTIQAQNAFLKTIEEPPKGVYIILLCENLEHLLETVKSRCQIHMLKSLSEEEIMQFLNREYKNIESSQLQVAAAFSEGLPGKAEKFLSDDVYKELRNKSVDLLLNITKIDKLGALEYENFFTKYKDKQHEILNCMMVYLRDAVVYKETENINLIINKDKNNEIQELANMFSFKKLSDIIETIEDTFSSINRNVNDSLVFDVMLLKLQEG